MRKWNYIFLFLSILSYFLTIIFPVHSGTLLVLSFCIGLVYFYLLWNYYPNYQLPIYLLFLFSHLLNYELGEVTFLLLNFLLFYTFLVKIFIYFNMPQKYFINKISYFELLSFITILVGSIFKISFYYISIFYFIFFMGNKILCSLLLWISLDILDKKKIVINDIDKFKKLYRIKNIIFNKTGVLTLGNLAVSKVVTSKEKQFWKYLSYAEATKNDRIAEFIKNLINYQKVDLKKRTNYYEFRNGVSYNYLTKRILVGNRDFLWEYGINILEEELIGTYIYVVQNNEIIGHIILSDKVNLNTRKVIARFRNLGIKHFAVFSNDQDKLTTTVARTLGIRDSYGSLTPKKGNFWLYYLKQTHSDNIAFISNNNIDYDVKVKIKISTINDNNSDIIVREHNLESCVSLFKLSSTLHRYELFWYVIVFIGQVILLSFSLLFFNRIWMIELFSFIWLLFWIVYLIIRIIKSWEE